MAGATWIYGVGQLESGIVMDFGQLVMDDEFVGMVKYVCGGIPVTDATLAVDVIRAVGIGRDFLSADHTLDYMHTAQTHPRLLDRRWRKDWEAAGSTTVYEKAWDRARHLLSTHQPAPLPAEVRGTLASIVSETEARLEADASR